MFFILQIRNALLFISDIITYLMIAGLELEAVTNTDYYRRFLILQQILNNKEKFIEEQHQPGRSQYLFTRYANLVKELSQLERHMQIDNHQYYSREQDINLSLEQMEKEYQRCFLSADSTIVQYEKRIMQTWRDGITQNEEKEKIGRNQSESRATNNKNLMLLTAELLKKERQTKHIIQNECNKLTSQIEKTLHSIQSKRHLLQQHTSRMNQNYFSQKHKVQKLMQLQNDSKRTTLTDELKTLQSDIRRYKLGLAQQKNLNQKAIRDIQQMLDDLHSKLTQ